MERTDQASTSVQDDSQFQMLIRTFRHSFGIRRPEDVRTEQREILPESIRIDAIVVFENGFDFTTLSDRIFPFLGRYNVFEYKGEHAPLQVGHFFQYSLVELGLMTVRLLSQERKDRQGLQWLSQQSARAQWLRLEAQGAHHSLHGHSQHSRCPAVTAEGWTSSGERLPSP